MIYLYVERCNNELVMGFATFHGKGWCYIYLHKWRYCSITGLKARAGFQVYTPVRVTRVNPCSGPPSSIIGPSTMRNDRLLWPLHPLYRVTPAISVKVYPTQDPRSTVRGGKKNQKEQYCLQIQCLAVLVFYNANSNSGLWLNFFRN
jgi:hypothetical protein